MKAPIQINNVTELIQFIEQDNITIEQASEITCKALTVFGEATKKENLIDFINKYYKNNISESPLFLNND